MPHRRDAPLYLAALALFAAALRSFVLAETTSGITQTPSAAASASAGSGGRSGSAATLGGRLALSSFAPPWASAVASVSGVTASAACSLFGRETSAGSRDSLGLATAAACGKGGEGEKERRERPSALSSARKPLFTRPSPLSLSLSLSQRSPSPYPSVFISHISSKRTEVATNLELWLKPLLSGGGGGGDAGEKPFLPPGAKPSISPLSSPGSDALAADRAAVASTATASASTTSGDSFSAASASATANARPVCSAATLFPGAATTRKRSPGAPPPLSPVCSAPSFELVADGGRCAVDSRPPHAVVCVGPSVTLEITPPRCSLGSSDDDDGSGGGERGSSFPAPSRSLVVDAHCGPPASIATGGQRIFLGGKSLPVFALNGSSSGDASLAAEFDRAAAALSSWPSGWGGAPLADAKSLAELVAISLLPGKVTATASVAEEQ